MPVKFESKKFVDAIRRLPNFLISESTLTLEEIANNIKERMSVAGQPVRYPINWDSLKQKIYVIIKLRKEGNLPYRRRGNYIKGIKVMRLSRGGVKYSAKSPAGAIGGTIQGWQSRVTKGRWTPLRPTLLSELRKLPSKLLRNLHVKLGRLYAR